MCIFDRQTTASHGGSTPVDTVSRANDQTLVISFLQLKGIGNINI